MTDPYPLRAIDNDDYETWARVIANTYGEDRVESQLTNERLTLDLDRTIGAFDGDTPIGGAAILARSLTVPGAFQPVAGISWVGVAPTHRRRGVLTAMMRRQLAGLHESGAEPIAVLNASEAAIYGRFGYGIAGRGAMMRGVKRAMGFRPGVDFRSGTVRLLDRDAARPLLEKAYDEARVSLVGWLERPDRYWETWLYDEPHMRGGATSLRFAVHADSTGATTGYAIYRLKSGSNEVGNQGTVHVVELVATTRSAYAALWHFLIGIDLFPYVCYEGAPDEPLLHLLNDPSSVRVSMVDRLWVRLVDVDRALTARRYSTPLDVVFDVEDTFCPWNVGRYRLRAEGADVSCERVRADADLRLSSTELGAAILGGTTLAALAAAGRVEELRPGALAACSTAFRGTREPFNPTGPGFPCY
ncbi:GNAT family N-acetyltransferase [Streptomyces sp. NPDC094034]|uniref:GNAT family N-acetyltransferase n=1 Tax=Streptomyces sp. NPDC094034 TaxID=3155309 RepID=UPI0033324DBA